MHLNACSVWTSSGFFFTQLIFFSVLLPSPSHPPSVFHLYQSLHSIPSSLLSRLFHTISTVASYSEGACLHLSTSQPPQVHSSSTCLDKLLSGRQVPRRRLSTHSILIANSFSARQIKQTAPSDWNPPPLSINLTILPPRPFPSPPRSTFT